MLTPSDRSPRTSDATAPRPQVFLFLDESGTSQSDARTLVGATAFRDVVAAEKTISDVHSRVLGDASRWPNEDKRRRFAETGFHFVEDSEAVRDPFLRALGTMDFRAYAAHAANDGMRPMRDLLTGMYGTLLMSVLARYRDHDATVVFEQNTSMDALYGKLWSVLRDRVVTGSARALRGGKDAPCLAVTDYVLGVTRIHLRNDARDFERGRFKALGRNYAYLIDYDDDRHFGGSRRPIV